MAARLVLYLVILILGGIIGSRGFLKEKMLDKLETIQTVSLLFLLFVMGVRIGLDKAVTSSFLRIGFKATILSVFSIAFSILFVKLISGHVMKEKGGDNI